jgi:hypothetical protein
MNESEGGVFFISPKTVTCHFLEFPDKCVQYGKPKQFTLKYTFSYSKHDNIIY